MLYDNRQSFFHSMILCASIYSAFFFPIIHGQGKLPYFVAPPMEEDDDETEQNDEEFGVSGQEEDDVELFEVC